MQNAEQIVTTAIAAHVHYALGMCISALYLRDRASVLDLMP
jgi:hypothetical protein